MKKIFILIVTVMHNERPAERDIAVKQARMLKIELLLPALTTEGRKRKFKCHFPAFQSRIRP